MLDLGPTGAKNIHISCAAAVSLQCRSQQLCETSECGLVDAGGFENFL